MVATWNMEWSTRRFLLFSPPEILSEVLRNISALDLLALYMCGDCALNSRLTQPLVLTHFTLQLDARHLRFPSFIFAFPSLISIDIQLGYYSKCYGISKSVYSRLPKGLQSLKLCMHNPCYALTSSYSRVVSALTPAARQRHFELLLVDLPKTFPLLDSLTLDGSTGELTEPDCVFPPFLRTLDLQSCIIRSTRWLSTLPDTLTTLNLGHNALQDENIATLPSGLLHLRLGFNNLLSRRFISLLPKTLLSLAFETTLAESKQALKEMPESLTRLEWSMAGIGHDSEEEQRLVLPPNLRHLKMRMKRNTVVGQSFFDALPSGLEFLELSALNVVVGRPLPRLLHSFTCSSSDPLASSELVYLPDSLLELDLTGFNFDENSFSLLPSSLRHLVLLDPVHALSDVALRNLQARCPDLTDIELPESHFSAATFPSSLPRRLTYLEMPQPNVLSRENAKDLPVNLQLLQIAKQTQFDVECLTHLQNLTWLSVAGTQLVDTDVPCLPRALKSLVISSQHIWTSRCTSQFPPRLTRLDILSTTEFDDASLAHLPRSLVQLRVVASPRLTTGCINFIPIGMSCLLTHDSRITEAYFEHQEKRLSARHSPHLPSASSHSSSSSSSSQHRPYLPHTTT